MRYHAMRYLREWPNSKTRATLSAGEDMEPKEVPCASLVRVRMVQPLRKTVWRFLLQLNILLPYNPTIVPPGTYPHEMKIYIRTKICTQMFIAALTTIAQTWKQPRCP